MIHVALKDGSIDDATVGVVRREERRRSSRWIFEGVVE
jgi:hypothetical protein